MGFKTKLLLLFALSVSTVLLAVIIGSVPLWPQQIWNIICAKVFNAPLNPDIPEPYVPMVTDMRMPRAALAFVTGAALSMSGAVMQSALQNTLASPYNLGVSAGAGLGASIVIITGIGASFYGAALFCTSLAAALLTVFFVIALSAKLDANLSGASVVLVGMVVSLFCAAVMNALCAEFPQYAQRITMWQLGSFSMKEWGDLRIITPLTLICGAFFLFKSRELDIMTFGDEPAKSIGVDLKRVKASLMAAVAVLTGGAVAVTGIIGFVDLVMPFIARKLVGAKHSRILPASALLGGAFMTLCDIAARVCAQPKEIPIGAVTAFLGAPFFFYIFFKDKNA